MNWKSVRNDSGAAGVTGLNYSCQDNPALRSCARGENAFNIRSGHQQAYGCPVAGRSTATVDVEDLGRCFEDQNSNYTTVSQRGHGIKVIRGVYRGASLNQQSIDPTTNFNSNNSNVSVTPSERTWVNMKDAFREDETLKRIDDPSITESNGHFVSRDLNKMAKPAVYTEINYDYSTPKWRQHNIRQFYYDKEKIYDASEPGYFDQTLSWFGQDLRTKPEPQFNITNSQIIYQRYETPYIQQFNLQENQGRIQSPSTLKSYNFCTEDQWLRCPAPQCPTQEQNYDFNSPQFNTVLPCMDQSSKLHFYYGEDIGYLTPAEYQRYEEDSLSNEKRKEKSRDAARCRRSRETDIFTELGKALPVPEEQAEHLDKASVMRLAIAYLKVRTVIDAIPEPLAKPEPSPDMDGLFLKALDGFMMVLSSDGDMVYLSENVSEYLGVSQMDMMGQNVYDYSHPCDHDELRECLLMKTSPINDDKQTCNLFVRLKCTLTSKGRKVNLKSASYKVIHCIGHMVITPRDLSAPQVQNEDNEDSSEANEEADINEIQEKGTGGCLVVVGCPVPHPSNIEAPLGRYTFLSKHSLNMKFTYADEKLAEYLGWDTNELVGQSVFEFHHALDNPVLDKSFKSLFSKGQCETAAYRFLGKKGGYAWVVTQATLIHCAKQHKPLSVVCVNYILSGIECENEVYSARQLEARSVDAASSDNLQSTVAPVSILTTASILNDKKIDIIEEDNCSADIKIGELLIGQDPIQERSRPLSVTASLFRIHEKSQGEVSDSKKLQTDQSTENAFAKTLFIAKKIFDTTNLKEENTQLLEQRTTNPPKKRTEHIFQGKPVGYLTNEIQRVRPQAVTSSLFSPAPSQLLQEPPSRPSPQTSTASIFAPRTKDMNKGFLTFSEDQPGLTMLKDEPEDLTHLAPTPGDVCVPLEDTPFLSDMLDDFILGNDNYCPLLSPGLPNELRASELGESLKDSDLEESLRSSEIGESLADSDPFMYRDSPSSCSGSPNLLSPALSKSPGSIDSLCSPSGSGGGLSEDEMLMLSIGDVLADEELALRAPYIPMSDQDETLQLFISNDMVMWPQPPDKKPKWSNVPENLGTNISSSLEQLLRNNSGNVRKCNDHGGGLVDPTDALGSIYKKNIKEETIWQSKSERTQKRLHCTTSGFENDKKRLKCSEERETTDSNVIDNKSYGGGIRDVNVNLNVSSHHASSQLLQQLMSQQSPVKNRGDHSNGGTEGGGGTGTGTGTGTGAGAGGGGSCRSDDSTGQQHPQQQSNSVLMNLLVSGCDVRAGYICLTKQKPSKSNGNSSSSNSNSISISISSNSGSSGIASQ